MAKKTTAAVNWTFGGREITSIEQMPENTVGFVYIVRNMSNGKVYYGKKSIYSHRKKRLTVKEKTLTENKRKTFKKETTETTWQKYTGSCHELNADIKTHKYEKEILRFCTSRVQMSVFEMKYIFCEECLESDHCYNANIAGKFYRKHFTE